MTDLSAASGPRRLIVALGVLGAITVGPGCGGAGSTAQARRPVSVAAAAAPVAAERDRILDRAGSPRLLSVRIRGTLTFPVLGDGPDRSWALELTLARAGAMRASGTDTGRGPVFEIVSDGARMTVRDARASEPGESDALSDPVHDEERPWLSLRPLDLVDAILPQPLPRRREEGARGGPMVIIEPRVDGAVVHWMDGNTQGAPRPRLRVWLSGDALVPARRLYFNAAGRPRLDVRYPGGIDDVHGVPRSIDVLRPDERIEYRIRVDEVEPNPAIGRGVFRIGTS